MRKIKYIVVLLIPVLLAGCLPTAKPESNRVSWVESFNGGWSFHRAFTEHDPVSILKANDITWESVSLPHTTKLEPKVVNDLWQGIAWYRKQFLVDVSLSKKQLYIKFEGAMNVADVWLNGQYLLTHVGGYLPFTVDITDHVKPGAENTILVKLDNRDNKITGPKPLKRLDFNTYGGLYRDVNLLVKDPVHITDEFEANVTAGGGTFVTYPRVTEQEAEVAIKTHVRNSSENSVVMKVVQELVDLNGIVAKKVSDSLTLASNRDREVTQKLPVMNPALWTPESPSLYELKTTVLLDNLPVDTRTEKIGIREFKVTREGLYINGKKTFLRGVNRHQEYPYVGYALSSNAQYRDAVKIKEAGFDYVRLSHYPHSPDFMQAADEIGLVLLDSILGWQYYSEDPDFHEHIIQTCRDMIRRDRNRPSVLAWECSLNESPMPDEFVEKLNRAVHEEYPGKNVYSAGWQKNGYDIYLQARQHRIDHYEDPGKPYIVSEYGDWEYYAKNAGLNQDGWGNLIQEERSSRQLLEYGEKRLLQQAANVQEAHNDNFATPAFADGYWGMFDYNRGYSDDLEASGVMSIDRRPKYSYYFFRSQRDPHIKSDLYQSGPMVFIASRWDGESTSPLRVYSNCDEVELLLDGKSQGRKQPDRNQTTTNLKHPPFSFEARYTKPGTLEAIAFCDGKSAARHVVSTPGAVEKLSIAIDESSRPPQVGVNDLVFVYISLLDLNGTLVPLNGEQIGIEVSGGLEIMNVGPISTETGVATVLVRVGDSLAGSRIVANYQDTSYEKVIF